MWANYIDISPWNHKDWVIHHKVSKELEDNPFDGDIHHYKEWRDNIRDHLLGCNQGYGRVLWEIEHCKFPLSMRFLEANPTLAGMNIDMTWITRSLWTFMLKHAKKSTRNMFKTLVDGEELNGAELWRTLYVQNKGGANEAEAVDLGALHTFPKCPNSAVLQSYLGLWMSIVDDQCSDLPARHLNTLLLKMLPADVLEDINRQKLLNAHYK